MLGIVLKTYNSFYYVRSGEKVIACSLRGRFKKEKFSLLVGDEVEYSLTGDDKGVIEKILPRRSLLKRPMVANVDQVVLTFAAASPDINTLLVDKFLVLAEASDLNILICINKTDLADMAESDRIAGVYRQIGYKVILASAYTGMGVDELRSNLFGHISVFAGPSGVGKSSLLNALDPELSLTTGKVSEKIGRGKHTTRFAELFALAGGGYVVDTPGFSLTDFSDIAENELTYFFPEFAILTAECKFNTCLHIKEPQCAVKQAVIEGKASKERYDSYLAIISEIRESKKGF